MGVKMYHYAEIDTSTGIVRQVWENKPADFSPPVSQGCELRQFPDTADVKPGMIWNGTSLLPKPPRALADEKASAKESVRLYAEAAGKELISSYPEVEVQSWPVKVAAAEAYLAGTATQRQTDMLTAESNIVGVTIDQLANTIIAKAAVFEQAAAQIAGMRQKVYAQIDAATTKAEIDTILNQAKIEADNLLAQIKAQL